VLVFDHQKGIRHGSSGRHRRPGAAAESKLVFDRYGKDNVLSQIWVVGLDEGRAVPKSEVERERAALLRREGASVSLPGHRAVTPGEMPGRALGREPGPHRRPRISWINSIWIS
jgi:hypothetical protein